MAHHRLVGLVVVALLSLACGLIRSPVPTPTSTPTPTPTPPPSAAWQSTVDDLAALQSLEIPDHLLAEDAAKTGEEFDVNEYFLVLDRLSVEAGYVLDYVYFYGGIGAEPILYARPVDQSPYVTYSGYQKAGGYPFGSEESRYGYLEQVRVDDTEEGFFQFILLRIMGGQFYLFWHANYNDRAVICDRAELERILVMPEGYGSYQNLSDEQKEAARAIDLAPVVEMEDDVVVAKVVVFTKWGGFSRETYTINRSFPHAILDSAHEVLVAYDCGIEF
jgi:hypothetical protein